MGNQEKNNKILIPSFIIASLIFSLTVWSNSDTIKYTILILVFYLVYTLSLLIKGRTLKVSGIFVWFLCFESIILVYANISPYVGWHTFIGYSLKAHIMQLISILIIMYWIQKSKMFFWDVLNNIAFLGTIMICTYVLIKEWDYLEILVAGNTSYRLGYANQWNPNSISIPIGIFSVITIISIVLKHKHFLANYFIVCYQIVYIFLTKSKKSLFMLGLAFLFVGFFSDKTKNKIKYVVIDVCILAVSVYLMFSNQLLYNMVGIRIEKMLSTLGLLKHISSLVDASTLERTGMIKKGIEMFLNHPYLGNGWNSFAAKSGYGTYAHNTFIEIAVSMGLFGLIVYLFIYYYLLREMRFVSNSSNKKISLLLLLCALLLDVASVTIYGSIFIYVLFEIININNQSGKT